MTPARGVCAAAMLGRSPAIAITNGPPGSDALRGGASAQPDAPTMLFFAYAPSLVASRSEAQGAPDVETRRSDRAKKMAGRGGCASLVLTTRLAVTGCGRAA